MNKKQIILNSLLHTLAVVAYIVIVAFIINAGNELFSKANQIHTSIGVLLLFTVSAAITGLLVFGKPIYLFLNGQKQEAIKFLFLTLGWLFCITIIFLSTLALLA
jgi:hypothetical protein